jgi:hypothetical protein
MSNNEALFFLLKGKNLILNKKAIPNLGIFDTGAAIEY